MTPIERAARALYGEIGSDFDPFGEGEDAKWPEFVDAARAVLNALMECASELSGEAYRTITNLRGESETVIAQAVFEKMIDAALADE